MAAVIVTGAVTTGTLFSRMYWGYWWTPPELRMVARVTRIESFAAIWPRGAHGDQPLGGKAGFQVAAQYGAKKDPSFPIGRLPSALAERKLMPSSDDPSAAAYFKAAVAAFDRAGLLVSGEPGYPNARDFTAAYLVLGQTSDEPRVLIVSTHGGQVSNDHYPQYDGAFAVADDGALRPLEMHRFFFDVAGIEGLTAWLVASVAAVPVGLLSVAVSLFLARPRLRRRPDAAV